MGASAGTLLLIGGVAAGPLGTFAAPTAPTAITQQAVQQEVQQGVQVESTAVDPAETGQAAEASSETSASVEATSETTAGTSADTDNVQNESTSGANTP